MHRHVAALLALIASVTFAPGQSPPAWSPETIQLTNAAFDPLQATPQLPAPLRAGPDGALWIVQFHARPDDAGRAALRRAGAELHGYLPHHAYLCRMPPAVAAAAARLPPVRWVGPWQPAYRLEPALLQEQLAGLDVPPRRYRLLVVDKRTDKPALAARIAAIGGTVVDLHPGSPLCTVDLSGEQLLQAARLDQVLWLERWTPPGRDMNNARIQGGGNHVEQVAGFTGQGVRGHSYDGAESNHPDFTTPLTNIRSAGGAESHGHCVAGIVFGNGTSAPQARGMVPDAVGFFTQFNTVTGGASRNTVIGEVVNLHRCTFTTASWGGSQTAAYTALSADADDIVFDHRIPWTQSMSNTGSQLSRPEAWGKNLIAVGGVRHFDNADPSDDVWQGASVGPAADGRIKPDLVAYYDLVWTSDRTGSAGYAAGNSFTAFNGTSAATAIVAGHGALLVQMFTEHLFGNLPRVCGGDRFANRPLAQTLKAMLIAGARQYPFGPGSTTNLRVHQGWGFPNVQDLLDRRGRSYLVPEDRSLRQGDIHVHVLDVAAGEPELKVCLTWLEPMGNPGAALSRINDLHLRVRSPSGTLYRGNVGLGSGNWSTPGGVADTVDTVECVFVPNPAAGSWTIEVEAALVAQDAHLATPDVDATYALAVMGARASAAEHHAVFLFDRSASMATLRSGSGTSRADFAVATAQADVDAWFTDHPGGEVALLEFQGTEVRRVGGRYVDAAAAQDAMANLLAPPAGGKPLAMALCCARDTLLAMGPQSAPWQRSLYLYSDGGTDSSPPSSCRGTLPEATAGDSCPNVQFPGPGGPFTAGSWQAAICASIEAQIETSVYHFAAFTDVVDMGVFFGAICDLTGGLLTRVPDGSTVPADNPWRVRGRGCSDFAGTVLWMTRGGIPQPGATVTIGCHTSSPLPWVLGVGFSDALIGGVPLPLELGSRGAPGCRVYTSWNATDGVFGWNARRTLTLPNVASLAGLRLYYQGAQFDTRNNALGLATSNLLQVTIAP